MSRIPLLKSGFGYLPDSDLGKSINCTHHLHNIIEIDCVRLIHSNEEEVQNHKETKEQITQEDYNFFTYAQSNNYVKRISVHNCIDPLFSFTPSVI